MSNATRNNVTTEVADIHTESPAESEPAVIVRSSSSHAVSRRRFLSGSLAIGGGALAGSAMLGSNGALAADCDRNPKQVERCSDSDEGESADPANCGRCGQESPVPSSYSLTDPGQAHNKQVKTSPALQSPGVTRISD